MHILPESSRQAPVDPARQARWRRACSLPCLVFSVRSRWPISLIF